MKCDISRPDPIRVRSEEFLKQIFEALGITMDRHPKGRSCKTES